MWLRAAILTACLAPYGHAQNDGGDWEPIHDAWPQAYLPLLLIAAGTLGYWWFLSWLTRRRLSQTGWRATRVIWPTTALALPGLAILAEWAHAADGVVAVLACAAAAANLPGVPVLWLVSTAFERVPLTVLLPAGTAASWFLSRAAVSFFEDRAQDRGPVSLGIERP
jgi:hypothetical protein